MPVSKSLSAIAALLALTLAGAASGAELPTRPWLPLERAVALVEGAVSACAEDGYPVSAAVTDRSGVIVALHRGDGAGPHTIDSSSRKAYTAASLGVPTAELARIAAENPAAAGLRDMGSRILILGGGLPLKVAGQTVGGIGVGGAPGGHLDEACARQAIDTVLGED